MYLISNEDVILSERGPRRFLQPGGGESKDLRLLCPHKAPNFGLTTLDFEVTFKQALNKSGFERARL
jgi:hypothetical protein